MPKDQLLHGDIPSTVTTLGDHWQSHQAPAPIWPQHSRFGVWHAFGRALEDAFDAK
ncbi:MAG: hypothetical protein R3E79_43385 [Caldilineaceae bacterium]